MTKKAETTIISFRATPSERDQLEAEARKKGCSLANHIRHKLFAQNDKYVSRAEIVSSINRAAGAVNSLIALCEKYPSTRNLERTLRSAKDALEEVSRKCDEILAAGNR